MKKITISLLFLIFGLSLSFAQSEDDLFGGGEDELFGDSSDEDDLFGGENSLFEEAEESSESLDELLLVDEKGIHIGGSFNLGISAGAAMDPSEITSVDDLEWDLTPDLSASLYFDARPLSAIRLFGKAAIEYPFAVQEDDPETVSIDETRTFSDIIYIKELFSDFNINDTLFFRAGKQTINWGVGYFFSPADLLNLTEIDPENPDEELEGPLSVKMNLPLNMHNIYLYAVLPEGINDPADLAFAPKAELVLGATEIGIGAYYRYGQAPAAMVTFTTAIGDVNLFGEGVAKYGSDKNFIVKTGDVYSLETYKKKLFFNATLGAGYSWSSEVSDLSFSLTGQYYFNGEGYDEPGLVSDFMNYTAIYLSGLDPENNPADAIAYEAHQGQYNLSDLMNRSKHYGAANISITPVKDLSFSVFWMGNFSDFSGVIKPGFSWNATDYIRIGLSIPYTYGDAGDEYTPDGDNLSFALEVSLGGSAF